MFDEIEDLRRLSLFNKQVFQSEEQQQSIDLHQRELNQQKINYDQDNNYDNTQSHNQSDLHKELYTDYLKTHRLPINYTIDNIRTIEYPRRILFNKNANQLYKPTLTLPNYSTRTISKSSNYTKRYNRNFHSFTIQHHDDLDKETIKENIIENFKQYGINYLCVSYETEVGHSPHYHVVFSTKQNIYYKDFKNFYVLSKDKKGILHTVHKVERKNHDELKAVRYITKEGNPMNFILEGDLPQEKEINDKISNVIANEIMIENKTLEEIAIKYPGYTMMNLQKMKMFHDSINSINSKKDKKSWDIRCISTEGFNEHEMIIYNWICLNLPWINNNNQERALRKLKQKQLYIKGGVGCGKSSLLIELVHYFSTYIYAYDDWHNDYHDQHDLIVADEFTAGSVNITFLNSFSEGSPVKLRVKNSQYLKSSNLPMIICSNISIFKAFEKDILRNKSVHSQLDSRFLYVELEENINGKAIENIHRLVHSIQQCKYKVYYDQYNGSNFIRSNKVVNQALKDRILSKEMYKKIINQKHMNIVHLFKSRLLYNNERDKNMHKEECIRNKLGVFRNNNHKILLDKIKDDESESDEQHIMEEDQLNETPTTKTNKLSNELVNKRTNQQEDQCNEYNTEEDELDELDDPNQQCKKIYQRINFENEYNELYE